MIRTQIQLTATQARALKERARLEDRSVADLVRVSVTEYLARYPARDRSDLVRRAREMVGRYHSKRPDLAENHDRYLAEAYDHEPVR